MRVFVCADMEGVSGIVSRRQTDDLGSAEYSRACQLMQAEVRVCVDACFEAGATEVVIADSHGPATNLDPRGFQKNVHLVQGWPRPLNMMEGIQNGEFTAVLLLGHHSAVSSQGGNFPHTISSSTYQNVIINGIEASEAQLNAWVAGYFNVPVVVITGDDKLVEHAMECLPAALAVVTKRACGMYSAEQYAPEDVTDRLRSAVCEGLQTAAQRQPLTIDGPLEVVMVMRDRFFAHVLSQLPSLGQVGSHSISLKAENIVEAIKVLGALPHLSASYD